MTNDIKIGPTKPERFPLPWASDWGEDRDYGLWMAFTYNGVRQCFRWIKPGTFMMGSPENEPGRFRNEFLHEVTLTQGFWLGETTCTQELWEAVMGNNPSHFKGKKRPVENVSWHDCNEFIEKINGMMPGLELRLPTEAEWEYACRAGTQTAFSFGDSITTEQVNYQSKATVDVRSLPCNVWGLYEMHGNVWEWCSDWLDDYQPRPINPIGPEGGVYRVLRGGYWLNAARLVRSACRSGYEPDYRSASSGFRLARGHKDRFQRS